MQIGIANTKASVNNSATYNSAIAGAAAGLIFALLNQYVFKGHVPSGITAAIYTLICAISTAVAGFLTRRDFKDEPAPADAPADVKARFQQDSTS
jgi:hypothetical protein